MIKFNDPDGTADQQQCENTCGIWEPALVSNTRHDAKGRLVDIYFQLVGENNDELCICKGFSKCGTCPYLANYIASL